MSLLAKLESSNELELKGMKIRTIIVDDVELARERVKILLDGKDIEIVGEASNGRMAIEMILTRESRKKWVFRVFGAKGKEN